SGGRAFSLGLRRNPPPTPPREGSRCSSPSCRFPSWEGLGVGSWSYTMGRGTPPLLAVYRPMAHRSAAVAMKKYWHVINIGIQNTLVYRVNFLFRAVFALIPLAAVLFLWRAIYAGKEGGGEV